MKHLYKYIVFIFLLQYGYLSAISIVYNYRIAQATKQPIFEEFHNKKTIIMLLFDQYQKKYNDDIRQNFVGGLGSFIYEFESCYLRTDFAVSHIKETTHHRKTFSDTETDDILFTLGGSLFKSPVWSFALSGLFGIPTHKIFSLRHIDFGYGQVGTGIQFDSTYTLINKGTLIYGIRYIYFIPRNARDNKNRKHVFTVGNDITVLFAYKNTWNHHGFEVGFTERIQFGAHVRPRFDDIVKQSNYQRSSFYAIYKYRFLINTIPNRILFNIGYGFDTSPKKFGNKHIILFWMAWNINF